MSKIRIEAVFGLLTSLTILLSYINLYVGIILSIFIIAIISRVYIVKEFRSNIYIILLFFNVFIISLLTKRGFDLTVILPHITSILILTFAFFVRPIFNIFPLFDRILLFAFIIDVSINVFTVIYHYDPFGRTIDIRSDGLVRSNGILGSSFLSVAINTIGLILAYKMKSRTLLYIALVGFAVNQSLRSLVTIVLFFVFILISRVIKNRASNSLLLSAIFMGILLLFAVTLQDSESNVLRVLAWIEAIDIIGENPFKGTVGFRPVEFDEVGISTASLLDAGITENLYLDFALHFGVISSILLFLFLSSNLCNIAKKYGNSHYLSLLAFLMLVNSFYGNLLTTTIFVFFFFFQFLEKRLPLRNTV